MARARNDEEWSERELELLSAIRPEGQCRPDTGLALTILARLVVEDALAALRRRDVYALLIDVCAQYARDVVSDANIVAVTGHPPRPHPWSVQAREAVEAAVPALLARWEIEPPANRFALAVLAGAFPSQGQVLAERVALLTAEQAGTKDSWTGWCQFWLDYFASHAIIHALAWMGAGGDSCERIADLIPKIGDYLRLFCPFIGEAGTHLAHYLYERWEECHINLLTGLSFNFKLARFKYWLFGWRWSRWVPYYLHIDCWVYPL